MNDVIFPGNRVGTTNISSSPKPVQEPVKAATQVAEALNGRYEVRERLGKGAFGEVYKAHDTLLNRIVAIKRIRLHQLAESGRLDELRARFLREAQIAAQLQHPGIVAVYDVIALLDTSYLIMEYVEGKTFAQTLGSKRALRASEIVHVLSQVADALHHAHQQKFVHRDVKPANILMTPKGVAKLADFGVAKAEAAADLTTAGEILGTPDYMSPEQARGSAVDGRSDLFSLGCILYECLARKKPFFAKSLTGVLLRIVNEEPAPIDFDARKLPREFQPVLERALSKDPAGRFSSGEEMALALRAIPTTSADEDFIAHEGGDEDASGPASVSRTPDSVADSLMKEARQATHIETHLSALLKEERRLLLAASPLLQFRNVSLTPEEAFILSRVGEGGTPSEILSVSPLSEEDTTRALLGFLRTGLVGFEDGTMTEKAAVSVESKPAGRASKADSLEPAEIHRLFESARSEDDWQVLGLQSGASLQQIKKAFQTKVFLYHPDRYGHSREQDLGDKLAYLVRRVNDAFSNLSSAKRSGRRMS